MMTETLWHSFEMDARQEILDGVIRDDNDLSIHARHLAEEREAEAGRDGKIDYLSIRERYEGCYSVVYRIEPKSFTAFRTSDA